MSNSPTTPALAPPLRVGFVGCGGVFQTCHLPALRSLGGRIQIAAVADADPLCRRRIAEMVGLSRAFADARSMLADAGTQLDALAVCTPAAHHADAVVAALQAGKHVLVEKPLSLTLDEADRIADCAQALPSLKLMVGFNLRCHRLVRRARELLTQGALGEVQLIRTLWTSGMRQRAGAVTWREHRQSGGGVLYETAVHHIDLLRYLTGTRVEQVFAASHHGAGDDESATLMLRMSNGAMASCVFCERAGDANEVEVIGSKGRLAFSLYRFDSFRLTPSGRLAQMLQPFRELPEAWPILRRGGDMRETYRQEWLAFADAVRHDGRVTATIEDGREALRVVLTAGASANEARALSPATAPRQPEQVIATTQAEAQPVESIDGNRPRLSAIVATRSGFATIRRTVRHLRAQTVCDQIELLIICPNERELGADEAELDGFWCWRVVEIGEIESMGRANAAGVRAAAAPLVVLCEDHAFPDPDWAQALIAAHRDPYAVVGPAVHNANPSTVVSWADCLIGYGPWLEPIAPCEPSHLPGHNSCYKRQVLLGYGPRLEKMMQAETVLHWDLRSRGQRLCIEPAARLAHTNFAMWSIWTRVQFHAGRMFAATRAMGWPWWKRALFTGASPLIPLVRLKRIWRDARRVSARERILPRVLPALIWGLALDGLGQMAGYASGAGSARQRIVEYEFERTRYITEQDRRELRTPVERARSSTW